MYWFGQLCGLMGTAITVVQPQFRKKEQILICTILVNGLNAVNFACLGHGGSSVYLCIVAMVQALVAIWHGRKNTEVTGAESILFFALYTVFGFYGMFTADGFVWEISLHNLLELLPIIGANMLMLSVFARGEQRTRMFLFLNAASWLIYTAVIGSSVVFTSLLSIISTGAALWKYRKKC